MRFYLGTHKPNWLEDGRFSKVPLFVSRRTLAGMKDLPRAVTSWALDSGGFTELSMFGRWKTTPEQYVGEVRRIEREVGRLAWAAPQDWMCEPVMLKKTKLTVAEHQKRTVENFLRLKSLAPELPFVPVVQGWTLADYLKCVERYERAGVDLTKYKTVGVGTVCRRQGTDEAAEIMTTLHKGGLRLHGFGFKTRGLLKVQSEMVSADSLAWSFAARMEPPLPGHENPGRDRPLGHQSCANCPVFALRWHRELLKRLKKGE
jgi:hypothetical protein